MSSVADELMAQAVQLPDEQRGELVDRLIESLHREPDGASPEEIKAAWITECLRRMAASDAAISGLLDDSQPG